MIQQFDKRKESIKRQYKELEKRLELSQDMIDRETQKFIKQQEKLNKVEARSHKYRLLYISRINEYRKELDFWRDTFRKVIVNKRDSESIIKEITATLKTYNTLYSDDDISLDYISIVGSIIKNQES